ncbi:hypothetical protein [Enterobacter roggenkampii]|uniref:hypothetical protein n=1 Tax=Enterobacter roggenkampii TaxID=1812935 RepID=UPI003BE7C402
MFKIILTTTEYFNGAVISTDAVQYSRRYKTRKAAERNAARMCETVTMPGSPVKYITVAEVRHA